MREGGKGKGGRGGGGNSLQQRKAVAIAAWVTQAEQSQHALSTLLKVSLDK
jgi:hypothetical protein